MSAGVQRSVFTNSCHVSMIKTFWPITSYFQKLAYGESLCSSHRFFTQISWCQMQSSLICVTTFFTHFSWWTTYIIHKKHELSQLLVMIGLGLTTFCEAFHVQIMWTHIFYILRSHVSCWDTRFKSDSNIFLQRLLKSIFNSYVSSKVVLYFNTILCFEVI